MNTEHKTEIADDELIAEFMSLEKTKYIWNDETQEYAYTMKYPECFNKLVCPSKMKYKTSFNWIMPVVEKINSSDISRIYIHDDVVHYHLLEWQKIPINGDLIGAIYKAVVIVLRWAENKK